MKWSIITLLGIVLIINLVSASNPTSITLIPNGEFNWKMVDSKLTLVEENNIRYDFDWGTTIMGCGEGVYIHWEKDKWVFGGEKSIADLSLKNYSCNIVSTDEFLLYEESEEKWYYKDNTEWDWWDEYAWVGNYVDSLRESWNYTNEKGEEEFLHKVSYIYPTIINHNGEFVIINNINQQHYTFKGICDNEYANCNWDLNKNKKIFQINFTAGDSWKTESIFNVSGCGAMLTANNIYLLNRSLHCPADALVIGGNNVTINMQGFFINHTDNGAGDYGIENDRIGLSFNDLTVFNGSILSFARGINQGGARGDFANLVIDNTGIDINGMVIAINLPGTSEQNHFENITISVINNVIGKGDKLDGQSYASLSVGAGYSKWDNLNIIQVRKTAGTSAVDFTYGLWFELTDAGVIINNSKITGVQCSPSCPQRDILLIDNTDDLIVVNSTYNINREDVDATSDLTRHEYYQTFVNDSNGDVVEGATIKSLFPNNNPEWTDTTNASGWLQNRRLVRAYKNNGGVRTSANVIFAEKIGYEQTNSTYNGKTDGENLNDNIEMLRFCWRYEDIFADTLNIPISCGFFDTQTLMDQLFGF